jgi:hypothetical protein
MQEADKRRIFLACGTVLLALLTWAMVAVLALTGPEGAGFVLAGIAFLGALLILVFNATMLFATPAGPGILRAATALLWVSFVLILAAFVFLFVAVVQYL